MERPSPHYDFFGPIWGGVIRIIRGKVLIGLLYMLTLGFFGIVWVIDILTLIFQHNMVFSLKDIFRAKWHQI